MTVRNKKLFIFDWDGTLIDSSAKIVGCMQAAIGELGFEQRSSEAIRNIIGLGLPEAFRTLFPNISTNDVEALRTKYSAYFVEADQSPCSFFPGVPEILSQLHDEGYQLAVATGKSRKGLNRVLNNLQMTNFFHATRCADETQSKPHPQMLQELLAELNADIDASVMVGDTVFDMQMAQAINMDRIAVSYGVHNVERLRQLQPILCVDEFSQLLGD